MGFKEKAVGQTAFSKTLLLLVRSNIRYQLKWNAKNSEQERGGSHRKGKNNEYCETLKDPKEYVFKDLKIINVSKIIHEAFHGFLS